MRAAINVNPTTLDPVKVQDVDTMPIIQNVFEGLVRWDENNELKPDLADKWEVTNGGTTYTFHLKKGVKFHNGRLMTAEDVQFSFDRACDPELSSPTAANYLGDIVGSRDRLARKAKSVSGIKVIDPLTIQITLDKPRAYFLGKLTYACAFVVCKEAVTKGKEINGGGSMIGTGPFKLDSFVPEQQLNLVAFDGYHDGRPRLDRIEEYVMKDVQTRVGKFRTGEVDLVGIVRQDILATQKDSVLGHELKLYTRPAVTYLAMNPNGYAPFKDVRVRRAFAMAIDKKPIVNGLLGGTNPLAEGILPPGITGHRDQPKVLPYDPTVAAKLLAEAGFPGGKGMPDLELVINDQTADTRLVAEALASQITKNLGVPVKLRTMEWRSLLEKRNKGTLGFFILAWYADYLDPQNFLSTLLTTHGPGNHYGYSNSEVDKLCDEADTTTDSASRTALYQRAEDAILQDAPWLPLYFVSDPELVSPRVTGIQNNLMGHLPYAKVEVK